MGIHPNPLTDLQHGDAPASGLFFLSLNVDVGTTRESSRYSYLPSPYQMKPCSASGDSAFLAQCSKIQTNLNKVWADNKALNIPGFMTTQPPQVNYTVVNGQRLAVPGEGNRLSYVIAGVMDCGAVDPLMKLDGATIHSYSKATPFGFRVAGTDKLTCVIMFGWTTGVGNNLGTTQKNQVSSAGTFEISTFLQPFSSNLAGPALGSP